MTNTGASLECPFVNGEKPKTPATIEATGKAVQKQLPDKGQVRVNLNEESNSLDEAWQKFQEKVRHLLAAVGTSGTVGTIEPTKDSKTISAALRGDREVFFVSASVEIYFPIENFGTIISVLADKNFTYSDILFTYSEKIDVSPELLEQASKDAQVRAIAVARGVGKTIGRLVSIHVGEADRRTYRPVEPLWNDIALNSLITTTVKSLTIDSTLFDAKMSTMDAHVVVAHVTAQFEIVE